MRRVIRLTEKDLTRLVKRILKEEVKNKIESQIDKLGLLQFMVVSKMSYIKILLLIGNDFLTNKIMIDFIKDIIREYGSISVYDIDEDPIFYSEYGNVFKEITYFGYTRVSVDVFEDNNNLGNFHVHYENLDNNMLTNVFELMVKAYESGKLKNI